MILDYKHKNQIDKNLGSFLIASSILKPTIQKNLEKETHIKYIAQQCLKKKWISNQEANNQLLNSICPFCAEAYIYDLHCDNCLCPPELCSKMGTKGLIGKFKEKYGNIKLKDMDPEDYQLIITITKELAKTGKISRENKILLEEYDSMQ